MPLLKISGVVKQSGFTTVKVGNILPVSFADAPPAISNNTTDPDHDIDISSAITVSDSGEPMLESGGLTKQLDASWSAGTNAGGLDTGSIAADTWYSVWAIAKANKVQDALFSTSATNPTLPSGYVFKRRIGWVRTDSSSNILAFRQEGDWFYWLSHITDSTAIPTTSGNAVTVSTPPDVLGQFACALTEGGSDVPVIRVQPTWATVDWPDFIRVKGPGGTGTKAQFGFIPVDSSSQIFVKRDANSPSSFELATVGWFDYRGRGN